ncbi:PAS domain S-box protein, partial [Leptolyngbya sp. FACHB-36]|uniref:PAS domain-containing protein n=1 Tax=Leptolyngbya sp. FACHB-36 TaxID=2692808 RepID=UPI00167FF394
MAPCSDRLLALLDSANELVQIVTLEGDLSYVSSAWCRLLGYAAEEVIQRCFFDFVHLADRDRCRRLFQALQSGNDADVRVTLLGKQGEIRVHGRIRYEAGEPPEIWSLWHPIQTALERPEAADTPLQHQPLDRQPESPTLEWERSLLRCLMDSTPDVIFCKSQDGNYLGCNQAFAALAGRSQSEIVGRNDWEIFSEASAAFVHEKDRQVVEARQAHRSEEWATYPDGQRRLLDTIKTPVVGSDGEVLGLIGICRDISDRAQAEDALRRSEEQRCLALDFSHIGSWDWNFATDTLTWNNNHYHILGLVPGHSPITPQIWRDFIHPDDLEQVEQIGATALSTYTNFEAEYRVIHLDGSVRWVVSRGRGVYNDRGD